MALGMTFGELNAEVMARTRQTSTEAQTRIGRELMDRYMRVTSTVGLGSSRNNENITTLSMGQPRVTFTGLEKVTAVWIKDGATSRMLDEITFDQWRHLNVELPLTGTPRVYAIDTMTDLNGGTGGVVVVLHPTPGPGLQIGADGLERLDRVYSASAIPWLPESFKDVLMHGALADEWMQLKQEDLSKRSEALYEQRLSELRYFIAKSAYLDIHQGARDTLYGGAYWPAYNLPRWWR